jgi:hypothetical protein
LPKADTPESRLQDSTAAKKIQGASDPRTEWERLISSRRVTLIVLFCVTGALGLPLLWLSSAFSTSEKVFWTLCNLLYTLALIAICIGICIWSYWRIVNSI